MLLVSYITLISRNLCPLIAACKFKLADNTSPSHLNVSLMAPKTIMTLTKALLLLISNNSVYIHVDTNMVLGTIGTRLKETGTSGPYIYDRR